MKEMAARLGGLGLKDHASKLEKMANAEGVPYSLRLEEIRRSEDWRRTKENVHSDTQLTLGLRAFEFVSNNPGKVVRLGAGVPEEQVLSKNNIDFTLPDGTVITLFAFDPFKIGNNLVLPGRLAIFTQKNGTDTVLDRSLRLGRFIKNTPSDGIININPIDPDFGAANLHLAGSYEGRKVIFPNTRQEVPITVGETLDFQLRQTTRLLLDHAVASPKFQEA